MSTLRERLERIRDRHARCQTASTRIPGSPCANCPDLEDAVAALATLDAAELTHEWKYPTRADAHMVAFRLVPDPPSRGETPNQGAEA